MTVQDFAYNKYVQEMLQSCVRPIILYGVEEEFCLREKWVVIF